MNSHCGLPVCCSPSGKYVYIHGIYCTVLLNTQKGLLKINASNIVLYNIIMLPTKHVVLPVGFLSVISRKVLPKSLKQSQSEAKESLEYYPIMSNTRKIKIF